MGFFLSILYFLSAYLGPATIFGPLAEMRIALILAVLVLLISVPSMTGSLIGKTSQSVALIGLSFTVLVSVLLTGWVGGAGQSFLNFIPSPFAYMLVCLHCDTRKRLKILILMLLFVCLFVIAHGYADLHRVVPGSSVDALAVESDYLFAQKSDAGEWFYRIRGLDFIADPNDFAQVIVCVIPLVFIFWKKKKAISNLFCVLLPVSLLLFGAFLTHSRGSILGMMAMTVVAIRRRIGTLASVIMAGGVFLVSSALKFTGGREISADAGSGRMDAWAFGMDLLRAHPLFGVGYGRFIQYYSITAHNSVVVCAAELGFIGLYFWSLFLFPTVRDTLQIASPTKVTAGEPIVAPKELRPQMMRPIEEIDKDEINRMGRLMAMSLTGFLVTAWFLSRSYSMTLFLLGGIAEVIFEMAVKRKMIAPRLPFAQAGRYAFLLAIGLLVLVYVVLRSGNLMR